MKGEAFYRLLRNVGQKLTELRKNKGYSSHEDFARDFDLPRIQYWRLEKGKANFTIFSLVRILSIHKLTTEEFFDSIRRIPVKPKTKRNDITENDELTINDEHGMNFFERIRL
jgi:transcriptional regulator with XRE-family HTH domain